MSLNIEFQSKWNVIQTGVSLKMKCHSNGMQLNWIVTQNGMSLKMECHSKWSVT